MKDGTLNVNEGAVIYVTNTEAEVNLSNVNLTNDSDVLMIIKIDTDDELSQEGPVDNLTGGICTFNAEKQTMSGNIQVDENSELELNLKNNTVYIGAINKENTGKEIKVTLDSTSVWNLTGDCYITTLENNGGTINTNGYKITYIDPVEEDDNRINSNYKK